MMVREEQGWTPVVQTHHRQAASLRRKMIHLLLSASPGKVKGSTWTELTWKLR